MLPTKTKRLLGAVATTTAALTVIACVGDSSPTTSDPGNVNEDDSGTGIEPETGRPSYDSGTGQKDGGDGGACAPDMPFLGPGTLVPGINGEDHEDQMTLTPNELTMYFASVRPRETSGSNVDIWKADRDNLSDGFKEAIKLPLNTSETEGDPMFSWDGRYLYFTKVVSGPNYDVFRVPADGLVDAGANASEPVASLNTDGDELAPYVIADGTIYFTRRPAGGKRHIHFASPSSTGGFGNAEEVTSLSSSGNDHYAILSADGLVVYWASDRNDLGTPRGKYDIFMATRANASEPFTNPRRLDVLSTAEDETPGWISPDGCRLYFTRHNGDTRLGDIFVADRRAKP